MDALSDFTWLIITEETCKMGRVGNQVVDPELDLDTPKTQTYTPEPKCCLCFPSPSALTTGSVE